MGWLDRGEICLNFELEGQGEPIVVLCHELGGGLASWDRVVDLLRTDFRILRWDQRGAGRSEKPVRPYPIERHADDLAALIDHLDLKPPYLLVGAAAGAAIALLFARLHAGEVEGAVLCSPSLGVDPSRRGYLLDRAAKAADLGMRGIIDASLGQSFPPETVTDAAHYQDYRAQFLSNDPISYGLANAALANFEPEGLLEEISFPIALLAGLHDRLRPPAYVESLARQIRAATYTRIDSGHIMPVQAPEAIAKAVRELRADLARA